MIVICDIDGTISRPPADRLQWAHKDWDEFYAHDFNDEPIREMISLLNLLNCQLIFLTSRSERVRHKTQDWLNRLICRQYGLLMRPDGDERPAHVLKLEQMHALRALYQAELLELYPNGMLVIEDDPKNVQVLREAGFVVLQMGDRLGPHT